VQFESWQHLHGCRLWIIVERDTCTHEILSVRPADDAIARALTIASAHPRGPA
jgi:sarcosine oxidase subunit delta